MNEPGLPHLPAGWNWTTLDELLALLRNGISKKPDGDEASGTPILRISSVRPGRVDVADIRYLRGDGPQFDSYALDAGDILFTRYNGTRDLVGVAAVVPSLVGRLLHPDKLIRAKLDEQKASAKYVSLAANTGRSRRFVEQRIRTTAGQAGISGGDVRGIPIPLAPRRQQDRIVAEVEKHFTRIDAGVAALERVQANLKRYRASVLKAAVEGRLVPTEEEIARAERRDCVFRSSWPAVPLAPGQPFRPLGQRLRAGAKRRASDLPSERSDAWMVNPLSSCLS